jgi:N-acetyl-anhydromuramyl-L-alanine amidase AmpD
MAMEIAEGGHPHVLANWFPLALKVPTSDSLLCLPRGSVRSWAHLCEQFVNAFQEGYKRLGTLNDLLALSQRPKELLHSFMQHFYQLAHAVVNTSDGKIIAAFIARVRDNRCWEELGIREPSTVSKLYALVDECA